MAPWLPRPRAAGARPRRLSGWTAVVPVAAAVAGLLFATSAQTAQGTDLRATGRTDLVDVIRNQTVRRGAPGRVGPAPAGRGGPADRAGAARATPPSSKVRSQADRWRPLVGTEPVSGPGLKVTLDDAKRTAASLPDGFTADDIVVHQQDVQAWSTRCGPAAPRR